MTEAATATNKPPKRFQPSLDHRIANALGNADASRETLASLWEEALEAHAEAKQIVERETARSLDLDNADPDASVRKVERAKLTMQRLALATNEFKTRVAELDRKEYAQKWNAEADRLKAERDALADELVGLYPRVVSAISALYARIDANSSAIDQLHGRAPDGEPRRLADAELSARELSSYTADQPRLRDHLKLPDWTAPTVIAFPIDAFAEFQRTASAMTVNAMKALERKHAALYGPDWFEGAKLRDEERRAEIAKAEEDEKVRQAKSQQDHYDAMRRQDEARRTGNRSSVNGAGQ